jgi:hypothetical protein
LEIIHRFRRFEFKAGKICENVRHHRRERLMKNNLVIGLLLGVVAGGLDLIPMLLQGLTWDANLSAFFLWVVSGFFLATTNLKLSPVLKGIVIPFICLLPSAFIIGWKEPFSLVPIGVMTLILGALLGVAYGKLSTKKSD